DAAAAGEGPDEPLDLLDELGGARPRRSRREDDSDEHAAGDKEPKGPHHGLLTPRQARCFTVSPFFDGLPVCRAAPSRGSPRLSRRLSPRCVASSTKAGETSVWRGSPIGRSAARMAARSGGSAHGARPATVTLRTQPGGCG